MNGHVELYRKNRLARWRWRFRSTNGQVTDGPQQAFFSRYNATRSARSVHPDSEFRVVSK